MSIVSINEQFQPSKYLIVSQQKDPETTITTRLIISDTRVNQVNLLTIEKGPQGEPGHTGPQGPAGKDGVVFDILPINSGGTNNIIFNSGYIIYYDGNKLASASVSLSDINTTNNSANNITGIVASSGLNSVFRNDNSVVDLSVALGDGLSFNEDNAIIVDDTIARVSQLSLGNIEGILPINKGGTNNTFFNQNRLVYFDGTRIRSYPIETGRFLLSGNTFVDIVAGSGLTGGGSLNVPNGSVVLNIPESADIIIEDNLVKLSPTGLPGTYSKVITDAKGRVVSGSVLTREDIIGILGYTPYHPGNDGAGSALDADLLDGQQGDFYQNAANITGTINSNVLPDIISSPGLYTKVAVNTKGLIEGTYYANQDDIITSLGYRPLSTSGGTIDTSLNIGQNLNVGGELEVYDNLPLFALNSTNILPSSPRGISFKYGGLYNSKTGIIAYYPTDNELKLVTNIFASGADLDGGETPPNQDDINGGNAQSIFIVENLDGDQSTVLLRHIADTLYVKTTTEQNVNGFKTFLDGLAVSNQIVIYDKPNPDKPPFNIGDNNLVVTNLNADYLDGNHGNFYRNAANVTGSFDYNNVRFDHIQGTHNFIPKFSDPQAEVAGKISDSNLYQDSFGNMRLDFGYNVSVGGDENNLIGAENSIAIGTDNRVSTTNSAAIGEANQASGDNSLALNYKSKTSTDAIHSIAAGSHGYTWLPNQLAIGAFRVLDSSNASIEQGQQSTTTMHLAGTEAHGSWRTMQPLVPIPRNKTIAYDIEILISKVFGTGVAHFHFTSGILKNASFRDPDNPIDILNITTHPQISKKVIGFNNSQIKTHFHTYSLNNDITIQQNVMVTDLPLKIQELSTQNVDRYYRYTPEKISTTGVYKKLNSGALELDISKPIFSGTFDQNLSTPGIRITSPNHSTIPNTYIDPVFVASYPSGIPLSSQKRQVVGSSNNFFYVESAALTGYLSYKPYSDEFDIATIIINQDSLIEADKHFYFETQATLNNTDISNVLDQRLVKFLRPGMNIKILLSGIVHDRVVVSVSGNNISINLPIYNTNNTPITNATINLYSIEYSYHLLKISRRLFVNNTDGSVGQFFANFYSIPATGTNFQNYSPYNIPGTPAPATGFPLLSPQNSGIYETLDFSHRSSIGLDVIVSKQSVYRSGVPVTITPMYSNTGTVTLHHKSDYTGTYNTLNTVFPKYQGIYRRIPEGSSSRLQVYNSKLEPISLPFAPVRYSLVAGYGDTDNNKFYIEENNDKYFLRTNQRFNYEEQDIYSVRIKAIDNSQQHTLEKNIFVYLQDSIRPYLNIASLPNQTATVLEPFTYTLPSNLFVEEENGGPITLSATIKNWHSLPDWLAFDSTIDTFSGIPSGCSLGPQTIRVIATNVSGAYEHIDFRINVTDPTVQRLSFYNDPSHTQKPTIQNIFLSNYTIEENLPANTLVGSMSCQGSYDPFCIFRSAYNNFSGIFRNKSNLIEVIPVTNGQYPTTNLTGTPLLLATGSLVSSWFSSLNHQGSLPNNTIVTHVYKPSVFSGTPLIDSYTVIFTENNKSYDQTIYSGIKVFAEAQYFDPNTTVKTWDYYSFRINSVILQENEYLLWTEQDDVLLHQDPRQTLNGLDTENKDNILSENSSRLLLQDKLGVNTVWSSGYKECAEADLLNGSMILYYPSGAVLHRNIYDPIDAENTENLFTELEEYLVCDQSTLKRSLQKLNPPATNNLKATQMSVGRTSISFTEPVNNPVLALYAVGLDSWGDLLTEDEYVLSSNDDSVLISDSFFDHGSRVIMSNNYEILDQERVYKNNGRLGLQKDWDFLLTEDNQPMVHDYAITAKSGNAFLLFPKSDLRSISIEYPPITDRDNFEDYNKNIWHTIGSLIPFNFATNKYFVRTNQAYVGQSATGIVVYSGALPETSNYSVSGLQNYVYLSPEGDCVFDVPTTGIKGFELSDFNNNYVTGLVDFYTDAGTGVINLTFDKDTNLDTRHENNVFLHTFVKTSSQNTQVPVQGNYTKDQLTNVTNNSVQIYNRFLLPESGRVSSGKFAANIDKNHGYAVTNTTQLNHVPARFLNVKKSLNGISTDTTLRPKDNIFNIRSISGNKVMVDDFRNYLLKEQGRPDYFDQPINARYITNGLAFSGTAFYNNANFYDIRYDLHTLERILKKSTFEYFYNSNNSELNINLPSGSVRPFDDLIVKFPSGFGYDTSPAYKLIDTNTINVRSGLFDDLEPLKDNILLESSQSYLQPEYTQKLTFKTSLLNINRDLRGTCDLDLKIEHRLQLGYLINYENGLHEGHAILDIVPGFNFSGFVPRLNNVIATDIDNLLSSEHIGFASVFNSGTSGLLQGGRLLRKAEINDIGYTEYYFIGSTGITPEKTFFSGIGAPHNPYFEVIKPKPNSIAYDFLYLGDNNNQVSFYGEAVLSGVSQVSIYRYDLETQTQLVKLSAKGITSGVSPIFSAGMMSGNINFVTGIQKFDQFRVVVQPNAVQNNKFELHTTILNNVSSKPWILDSSGILNTGDPFIPYLNPEEPSYVYRANLEAIDGPVDCNTIQPQYIPVIDPEYTLFKNSPYYVLPFVRTNLKYCNALVSKNTQLFFNGNTIVIDKLNVPKTYAQQYDEFEILKFNNQNISGNTKTGKHITKIDSSNNLTFLTGIIIDGQRTISPRAGTYRFNEIYEDTNRFNKVLGNVHNKYLPYVGSLDYIKSTSGSVDVLDYNNLYYHTYGGSTAVWPMDSVGKIVPQIQTGIYFVSHNPSSCSSGTLCVTISGFNNISFTGIKDINSRSNFGQFSNTVQTPNGTGYVRPYGVDKKMYFDFSDGFAEINGSYYINDFIDPRTISISIPYRDSFMGKAGIVYIIDSEEDIKSHLNPNKNNQFIISQGSISNASLVDGNIFNYFDHDTKRWKHSVHLKDNIPYTGHNVSFNGISSTILSLNPTAIRISGLEYKFGILSETFTPVEDNTITIPSNETFLTLRITTLDGEQKLLEQYTPSIPKVDISGLFDYTIDTNKPSQYNYHGSGWVLGAEITLPRYEYESLPVTIRAKDLTGFGDLNITLNKKIIPSVTPFSVSYSTPNSVWSLGFDIDQIDTYDLWINGDLGFELENTPSGSFGIKYVNDHTIVLSGSSSPTSGNFPVVLKLRDFRTEPFSILSSGTGMISIVNNYSQRPPFNLVFNNLETSYYFDVSKSTGLLTFDIPASLGPTPDFVSCQVSFVTNPNYRLQVISNAYDYDLGRFRIMARPIGSGDFNYVNFTDRYTNQTMIVSMQQPTYDDFGNAAYVPVSRSVSFDTTFYRPVGLSKTLFDNSLVFALDQPWFLQLDVTDGVTAHNPTLRPRVRIHNTPNLGSYESFPIEYNLDWEYDSERKRWSATLSGKRDFFGKYVYDTGVYPLYISIHDGLFGGAYDTTSITYVQKQTLKNIQNTVYATPDNEFFANADLTDLNTNGTTITNIIGSLKEPSIQISRSKANYDTDFKIWQYSFTGTKFTEKYDAQIVVNNSNLAVQCKGLGRDKIVAVAKLNMVEIESSELAGLPLTITGIVGYNPVEGTKFSQGEDAWNLRFKTIGGLADHRYPPTIILQNMPTFCNGYNPLLSTQEQCIPQAPKWNADDMGGSWSYVFSGVPSCTLLGRKDFTITAIDTNPSLQNPYLPDSDTVEYFFVYDELVVGSNPPQIIDDPDYPSQTVIKPLCGDKYQQKLLFGPAQAPLCGTATGIKTIDVSGSLPPGLSYSVFFPGLGDNPNPEPPYSNLGSGYLIIEGFPTTFASGEQYPEEFGLTVTDARNLKANRVIQFSDSSSPNDPNISFPIYFDSHKPILSPKTGLAPVDADNTTAYRPAPAEYDLVCNSVLPHNKCAIEYISYSGTTTTNTNIRLIPEGESTLANNAQVYIEFNDNPDHPLNSTYKIFTENNQFFINPGVNITPISGSGRLVRGVYKSVNIKNFDNFFGDSTLDTSTSKCLLGGGSLVRDPSKAGNDSPLGLGGLLIPSISGSLTGMNIFASNDVFLTGLTLVDLNGDADNYSTMKWFNCWETGYVRISGIIIPPISVEIPDPPPAQDFAPFSFNGQVYALATKLVFGDNEAQKLLIENQRRGRSLKYSITDLISNTSLVNGSVSSFSSFDTPVLNSASGTVYSVSISHQGDSFPTYSYSALPSASSTYVWVHKGDNLVTTPRQTSFPPVYPLLGPEYISVINDTSDEDPNGTVMTPVFGLAVGGYVTEVGSSWFSRNYKPLISGIIQKSFDKPIMSGDFTYQNNEAHLTIPNNSIETGYNIKLQLYRSSFGSTLITPPYYIDLEVDASNLTGDTILNIPLSAGTQNFNGKYLIDLSSRVTGYIPENNSLVIKHNGLPLSTGYVVSIDQNNHTSTSLYLLDKAGSLTVTSGDNSTLYITNNNASDSGWMNSLNWNSPVTLMQNFDDNIKIMPDNITSNTEGRYVFQITGRSNVLYKDYTYKICTMENINMPIFNGGDLVPKRYFVNYPLYVNKPISVLPSSISKTGMGSSWILTFRIEGGSRPLQNYTPDISVSVDGENFNYCGFTRSSISETLKDSYDSVNDQLVVQLRGNNAINWGAYEHIYVKVSDDTGFDIVQVAMT